jgi:FkbM family methyltransferase
MLADIPLKILRKLGFEARRVPPALRRRSDRKLSLDVRFVVSHFLRTKSELRFVQIGAYDGVGNDAFAAIIQEFPCRGILVEPQRAAFEALERRYGGNARISLANVAISDRDESRSFYTIDCTGPGKVPWWAPQLASFRRDVIMRHRNVIPDLEHRILQQDVECLTIPTLLKRFEWSFADMLQIDTEGFDARIIQNIDFKTFKPSIIRYEHKHLSPNDAEAVLELLIKEGYRIGLDDEDALAYRE